MNELKDMKTYAKLFETKHWGQGAISKVTDYSFTWTQYPKKENEKSFSCIYMLSYFL